MDRDLFRSWMSAVRSVVARHCAEEGGLYYGREGALRLARECAPALLDFGPDPESLISNTYSGVCVISYHLKPPVDAREWLAEMRTALAKAKATDPRFM